MLQDPALPKKSLVLIDDHELFSCQWSQFQYIHAPIIFKLFVVSVQFEVNARNKCLWTALGMYNKRLESGCTASCTNMPCTMASEERENYRLRRGGSESKVSLRCKSAFATNKAEDDNG
jgi:hypothetical protein